MGDDKASAVLTFLTAEYHAFESAARAGHIEQAWRHLERAHIVAQARLWPHCRSHWKMLIFAIGLRDWREAGGQMVRLLLAPAGNLTGRLPVGNSGRANISAFARAEIPPDLLAFVDPGSH
ncbi:DUF3703 domain-containing protein [Sphingopyxis panaciterrulae]|uniref:DUF3703 domain-containing protein n=1 Tax=Sphingopyxis panaciterrulae TaxID=462372 RepID=A0A7W9B790_9SPHN|nr:DUF3703 domain-containing protein [Sphingopyxis panaciterrulae]MBB5707316.1 hypothetical protein [Sphingopyxis panaciterrulae]